MKKGELRTLPHTIDKQKNNSSWITDKTIRTKIVTLVEQGLANVF